jgi:hypothetical protein
MLGNETLDCFRFAIGPYQPASQFRDFSEKLVAARASVEYAPVQTLFKPATLP